jgi:hypothetical protein
MKCKLKAKDLLEILGSVIGRDKQLLFECVCDFFGDPCFPILVLSVYAGGEKGRRRKLIGFDEGSGGYTDNAGILHHITKYLTGGNSDQEIYQIEIIDNSMISRCRFMNDGDTFMCQPSPDATFRFWFRPHGKNKPECIHRTER